MGPRSSERGNLTEAAVEKLEALGYASMGPRSSERGNRAAWRDSESVGMSLASMGPRSSERGNRQPSMREWRSTIGFNGAALV